MEPKNAKMFFEVYPKWVDGAANQLEKDKMRAVVERYALKGSTSNGWDCADKTVLGTQRGHRPHVTH